MVKTKKDLMWIVHSAAIFQYFNVAIKVDIFLLLHKKQMNFSELQSKLNFSHDSLQVLLFGLVSIEVLELKWEKYFNCQSIEEFINDGEYELLKSINNFESEIVYLGQSKFLESLQSDSNSWLSFIEWEWKNLYERFKDNPEIQNVFYDYMQLYSEYAMKLFLWNEHINFFRGEEILDVGWGLGMIANKILKVNSSVYINLMDLPTLENDFKKINTNPNINFIPWDFFLTDFPINMDTILFNHQLVIWSEEQIELLLTKSFKSLKTGGRIIIFSSMSNNDYSWPLMAALDTVYFKSIATWEWKIHSYEVYTKALQKAGFQNIASYSLDTWTPHWIITAKK